MEDYSPHFTGFSGLDDKLLEQQDLLSQHTGSSSEEPVDLSNSQNWDLVFDTYFQPIPSSNPNPNTIYPVYEFPISPILFDNPVVAIYAHSSKAPSHWQFAGKLIQRVAVGLLIGGNNEAIQETRTVRLNSIQVFILPQYTSTYQLNFRVAKWLKDIELKVWRYIGTVDDEYLNKFAAINSKLDTINQQL